MGVLTKEAITSVLGPVGDSLATELAATGASEEELREARAWVVNDEPLINELRPFQLAALRAWSRSCALWRASLSTKTSGGPQRGSRWAFRHASRLRRPGLAAPRAPGGA